MFSVRGVNMIADRRWWSERGLRECEMSLKSALSVSAGAASVLPDPAIISVFGLVFSLNMTQRYIYLILIMKDFN